MWTDCLGNPVTLRDPAGLAALDDFVGGFIASEARAVNIIAAADTDHSPLVQAYAAAVHMFAEARGGAANALPFSQRAQSGAAGTTPREQRSIAAIAAWVAGDLPRAIAMHEEQARDFPRDLASLKLGQYHLFNRGDAAGMLRMALAAETGAADVPYFHGMLAFGWEQCHDMARAEASARRAIAMERKEPWAHHALAHVMLTQNRLTEGHAFLADVSDSWTGLNSFMVTHNWWHQSLFALGLGQHDEALDLYDQRVWGVAKDYTQDQINAVSLLARLELAGVDVGQRWQDVAGYLVHRLDDHVLPFLDMQYLYGLARAGSGSAQVLMRNIESHLPQDDVWQTVCVPASRGLLAHALGDYSNAAQELAKAMPRMQEIGGSHAQRDLFAQIFRDAVNRVRPAKLRAAADARSSPA